MTDEINRLIATAVMGWTREQAGGMWFWVDENRRVLDLRKDWKGWNPCADIAQAWTVVERMADFPTDVWLRFVGLVERECGNSSLVSYPARDAARLICVASLRAVGGYPSPLLKTGESRRCL